MDAEFRKKTGIPGIEHIEEFAEFLDEELKKKGISVKTAIKLRMVVDEIYSNICYYSGAREVSLGIRITQNREKKSRDVTLYFEDDGIPYNPLAKQDPDVEKPLNERDKKGGLGIYLVKKRMDWVTYEYLNGRNCLTVGVGESYEVE